MRAWHVAVVSALAAGSVPPLAAAQALGFMEYSPIAYYTEEDYRIADEAGLDALDNYPDGKPREWENPATGASGSITPLETFTGESGQTCRKARAIDRTTSPPLRGEFVFLLCRDQAGAWQFVKRK